MHGFVIAGTNSGCGKTTVTIGLMALLKSMGKKIAAFKIGPDYIDPLFHQEVIGEPSYNLDGYMLSETSVKYLFYKHTRNKEIAIVEGVMGMYDGKGINSTGSTYEISRTLNLPVILVVNCKSIYQSVTAIVKGFASLKEDSNVKAVILNNVPNKEYYNFLKDLIEKNCEIPCIGYLPNSEGYALESRHLGLVQAEEVDGIQQKLDRLQEVLLQTIDTKMLLELSKLDKVEKAEFDIPNLNLSDLHIGIAYDKAFRFYYNDNLELLKESGASLYFFSPLNDDEIPEKCNCLYIGGGYPEVFSKELSANKKLIQSIKEKVRKGLPIYAECGGLMYLTKEIINFEGRNNLMAGVFNCSVQMTKKLHNFGYAQISFNGIGAHCHEFHRSKIIQKETEPDYEFAFQLNETEKKKEWKCGLKKDNCLAGYAHIHFYSNIEFTKQIVKLWKRATI